MKLVLLRVLSGILLVLALSDVTAQQVKWWEIIQDESINYYDAIRTLDEYYKDRDKGKGSGYKQYQRWKHHQSYNIDQEGNRISRETRQAGFEAFMRASASSATARTTPSNWVELGPSYWNRTSAWNPGVGQVKAIEVDPGNANTLYVCSVEGGCWKSTNSGTNWTNLTNTFTNLRTTAVTVDPANSNIVYLGCNDGRLRKSNDGGTTWNNSNAGLNGEVNKIIVHPTNSAILWAATSWGVYRSVNSGANWTQTLNAYIEDIELKPGDPSIVYGCGDNFYRSTDGGVSFGLILSSTERSLISITPANANYVYLIRASGSEFGVLLRSTDSGVSFATRITGSVATNTNFFGYASDGGDAGGQAWYDMAMCVSSTNAEEVYIAGIICWKSTNGGTSFTPLTEWYAPNGLGYNHADVHVLEYRNNRIYSGSDGGIYRSTDGGDNWTDLSNGLGIRMFYRIGCSRTNSDMVVGGSQDNGTSIRKTTGWTDWLGADGMEAFIDHSNANIVYGTSQYGSLYKSTNGGASYFNLTDPEGDGDWVTPFEIDPTVATTIYVGYNDLYKSTNGGTSWTAITAVGGNNFEQLAIAPSNSNYIYASKGATLYRTTNGGTTWATINTPGNVGINYITVHPANASKIALACGGTRVYTSADGGATFTNYTGTLTGSMNCAVYHNGTDDGLYVGTDNGVFYRNNTLGAWTPYLTGLPNVKVYELEIQYSVSKLRAGTHGRGLWETDLFEALPVYYLSFDAENFDEHKVQVSWVTTTEINSDRFEIERSHNGRDFVSIGSVGAAGNSASNIAYQYFDEHPLYGTSYYRLAQYDRDNMVHYTNYAVVERNTGTRTIFAFPNPTSDAFNVLVSENSDKAITLKIINVQGVVVYEETNFRVNQIYKLGEKLPAGAYIIEASDDGGSQSFRIVKQ